MKGKEKIDYSLYLVTDRLLLGGRNLAVTVEQAIKGGVTLVQIREKNLSTREFYQAALAVKAVTDKYHVPLIVNDRLDIALAVDAAGLHIGQEDMPLTIARKLLGVHKIVGMSAINVQQALAAQQDGADYLGVGAVFPTATKADADGVSLEELQRIKKQVTIPVVAIGGIHTANVQKAMAAGIDGVAVVSAIIGCSDPYQAAVNLRRLV